jgi:hypothetical protein
MRITTLCLASLLLAAGCGDGTSTDPSQDGGTLPQDAGSGGGTGGGAGGGAGGGTGGGTGTVDAGSFTGAGPYDLDIPYTVDAGTPITAPNETWTYVPFPDSQCANGTSTGIAVNLTNKSNRVLVYLQGGGSCWTAQYCAFGTAVHIKDTVGEATVLAEAQYPGMQLLFDRTRADNPFKDANFVYVPYCTGDLHSGTQMFNYNAPNFGITQVHHVGAKNLDAFLRRLVPTFPAADRVWLMGISAGGFGVTINGWRFQKAFPNARVDVLDDAGPLLEPASFDATYGQAVSKWAPEFPPGCVGCDTSIGAVRNRALELMAPPRRYALMSYLQDQTVSFFLGTSGPALQAELEALRPQLPVNAKTFYISGNTHVVSSTPYVNVNGLTPWEWVNLFANDAAGWDHHGP